jgi:hypothetical protein
VNPVCHRTPMDIDLGDALAGSPNTPLIPTFDVAPMLIRNLPTANRIV